MDRKLSIGALTFCHALMGAALGAAGGLALAAMQVRGFGSLLEPTIETGTLAVVLLSLSAWTGVGAGLSGFLLVAVERTPCRIPRGLNERPSRPPR